MTLIEHARKSIITREMKAVAKQEGVAAEFILKGIQAGNISIPMNNRRKNVVAEGVGAGLRTKVNANIGTSRQKNSLPTELKKLEVAVAAGADAVMDLSTGGDIPKIRQEILSRCSKPLGTVPIYEAFVRAAQRCATEKKKGAFDVEELFDIIEEQAEDGVDFMTIHAGLTMSAVDRLRRQPRVTGIVSRGGAFLADWMIKNNKENPLYEQFDQVLSICHKYDVTVSLGDGLRPGCLEDATDRAMIQEMIMLGELSARCKEAGVQAIIEGPGHMPMDQIESNVKLQKSLCNGTPYYVLGPLVTDIAPGYDHITSAIGGAIAAAAGADFICYVTPSEHLGLPGPEEVRQGVIAARIAGHAADIVKLGNRKADAQLSKARKALDWKTQKKLAIDPDQFLKYKSHGASSETDTCTMCGEFCAYAVSPKGL